MSISRVTSRIEEVRTQTCRVPFANIVTKRHRKSSEIFSQSYRRLSISELAMVLDGEGGAERAQAKPRRRKLCEGWDDFEAVGSESSCRWEGGGYIIINNSY